MKAIAPLLLVLLVSTPGVLAQTAAPPPAMPPPHIDTVDVEGQRAKDDAAARHFIMSFARQSPAETFALWRDKICPATFGMTAMFDFFVTQRVRAIATEVGAPVDRNDPCRTNIEIVFTPEPQATLDALRKAANNAGKPILGYENITKVKYPIQAWYGTVTRDDNGVKQLDDPFGGISWAASRGSRLFTGITGEFGTVLILVDSNAVVGRELGAVADYVALIALAQTSAFGTCQELPTIANLMVPDCALQSTALTDVDIGYLSGLYKSDNGGPEVLQRGRIINGMKNSLAGH